MPAIAAQNLKSFKELTAEQDAKTAGKKLNRDIHANQFIQYV